MFSTKDSDPRMYFHLTLCNSSHMSPVSWEQHVPIAAEVANLTSEFYSRCSTLTQSCKVLWHLQPKNKLHGNTKVVVSDQLLSIIRPGLEIQKGDLLHRLWRVCGATSAREETVPVVTTFPRTMMKTWWKSLVQRKSHFRKWRKLSSTMSTIEERASIMDTKLEDGNASILVSALIICHNNLLSYTRGLQWACNKHLLINTQTHLYETY